MITATVTFDISTSVWCNESADRHTLWALEDMPDGARARVLLGARDWPSSEAVTRLHRHRDRLDIDLEGDSPRVIRTWLEAVRIGTVGVPA